MQKYVSDHFEVTQELFAVLSNDFKATETNRAWNRFGPNVLSSLSDQGGIELKRLLKVEDWHRFQQCYAWVVENREPAQVEARIDVGEQADHHIEWLLAWSDRRQAVMMTGRDITAFKNYQSRYHEIEATAQIGVWEVDLAKNRVWWSDMVHHIHGTNPHTFDPSVGDALEFYHPLDRDRVRLAVDRMIQSGEPYDMRARLVLASGEVKWVRTKSRAEMINGKVVRCFGTVQDISTEYKRETEARLQAEKFEAMAEHIPVMLALFNEQGEFEWVNRQWEQDLGWNLRAMQGKDMMSLFHPDARYRQSVLEFMMSGSEEWRDFQTVIRNGSKIDTSWANVKLSSGKSIGIGQNISLRKKLENELKSANAQLQLAMDVGSFGTWELKPQSGDVHYSPGWAQMLGLDFHSLVHRIETWESLVHPDDKERANTEVGRCLSGEIQLYEGAQRLKHADGSWRWIQSWGRVTERDPKGVPLSFLAVTVDVTRTYHAEREAERYFNSSLTLLSVCGFDGIFRRVNPAFTEILGWSADEIVGRTYSEFLHPDDVQATVEEFSKLQQGHSVFQFENRYRMKSGGYKTLSWVSRSVLNEEMIYAAAQDVTKARESEVKMFHSARLASLGEMASGIAHEINNPLAIIRARSSQIKGLIQDRQFDKAESELGRIEATVDRIATIIRGLKTLSRDSTHDPKEAVSFLLILDDSLELARERIKAAGIELRLDKETLSRLPKVTGRPAQLGQVVVNLFNNSFDAIREQGSKWIEISARVSGPYVEILFTDSGRGIPPEIVSRMMDPFYTTKGVGKGTGLGLSISRSIVQEYGGDLKYDPDCPNTRFVLSLPVASIDANPG